VSRSQGRKHVTSLLQFKQETHLLLSKWMKCDRDVKGKIGVDTKEEQTVKRNTFHSVLKSLHSTAHGKSQRPWESLWFRPCVSLAITHNGLHQQAFWWLSGVCQRCLVKVYPNGSQHCCTLEWPGAFKMLPAPRSPSKQIHSNLWRALGSVVWKPPQVITVVARLEN
jgi:hypothetical protein